MDLLDHPEPMSRDFSSSGDVALCIFHLQEVQRRSVEPPPPPPHSSLLPVLSCTVFLFCI
ncbi:hypothetical protein EYF80_051718 [Liparis tanakae]|uniref:Uncharacterized protein n=1 Tax=Liparis tanakae TaxID=230148 RepID=A0A4Z2FA45_9TELE|nr:hypothetical protein EYF80_051718 [Liparis tanakae]